MIDTNVLSKKILVIEDEALLSQVLIDTLTSEGFSVLGAKNGEEGLMLALKEHPDLILLDIIMPVMDGMTMLYELRKDSWANSVPVILLTNLSDAERVAEALKLKVYDFLVKSDWRLEDLVKKIKEKLGI